MKSVKTASSTDIHLLLTGFLQNTSSIPNNLAGCDTSQNDTLGPNNIPKIRTRIVSRDANFVKKTTETTGKRYFAHNCSCSATISECS